MQPKMGVREEGGRDGEKKGGGGAREHKSEDLLENQSGLLK